MSWTVVIRKLVCKFTQSEFYMSIF